MLGNQNVGKNKGGASFGPAMSGFMGSSTGPDGSIGGQRMGSPVQFVDSPQNIAARNPRRGIDPPPGSQVG